MSVGRHPISEDIGLQRLFSTFPGGWPGIGLLLLRITVGATAIAAGVTPFLNRPAEPMSVGLTLIAFIAIACGVLLLIGFLTPGGAVLVAVGSAGVTFPGSPSLAGDLLNASPTTGFVIVMAVAVLLLGPGAFSLDSYLFGRREIVIPQFKKAASDRPASSE
jgi:uncharacterized membrane protein YphA (DoxX/SURF4 family)